MLNSFSKIDEKGNKVSYDILVTFTNEANNKNYMIYTDYKKDETGNTLLYSAIYNGNNFNKLEEIKSEEELKMIKEIIEKIQFELKNK